MPKLPVLSDKELIKILSKIGNKYKLKILNRIEKSYLNYNGKQNFNPRYSYL